MVGQSVNFTNMLTCDTLYDTHEDQVWGDLVHIVFYEVWGVLCEFKVWGVLSKCSPVLLLLWHGPI